MFSSLTSILPSGIGFGAKSDAAQMRANDDKTPHPRDYERFPEESAETKTVGNADELGAKKKRERSPYETFIVVRPPPSVSNHPLNLQLQLVPPQAKERAVSGSSSMSGISTVSTRRSVDTTYTVPENENGEGRGIDRSPSIRSGRSDPSTFYAAPTSSSTASMSSIASTSTSNSIGGRRMIVPLYNLSAHNVMTNTVLDAGTDAKIAKFHKRNLEILGLAILDCIEVWPGTTRGVARQVTFLDAYGATSGHAPETDAFLHTPGSSAISLSSAGSHPHGAPGMPITPVHPSRISPERGDLTPTSSQHSAKKIFGRIFKKKDGQASPNGHVRTSSVESTPVIPSAAGSDAGPSVSSPLLKVINRRSLNTTIPSPASSHFSVPPIQAGGPSATPIQVLMPALLGIQPVLSSPTNPPSGRATRYVWIIRKWLNGADSGLLGGVMRGVDMVSTGIANIRLGERASNGNGGAGGYGDKDTPGGGTSTVEIRFEWVRGQSKNRGSKRKSATQAGLGKRSSLSRVDSSTSVIHESASGGPKKQTSSSRARQTTALPAVTGTSRRSGEARRSLEGTSREESRTRGSPRDSFTSTTLSEEAGGNVHARGRSAPVGRESDDDDGEESDPEDSETPWTCTLVLSSIPSNVKTLWENEQMATSDTQNSLTAVSSRPRSHISTDPAHPPSTAATVAPLRPARPEMPGTLLRLKVGTLSPAPHHPKVVSQLKVPYPLPDIDITQARILRRAITPDGIARTPSEGLVLSAENIKDVLSCTAFWLVVREGFGGVGKEKRKGDGWRIRG